MNPYYTKQTLQTDPHFIGLKKIKHTNTKMMGDSSYYINITHITRVLFRCFKFLPQNW